jgi:hypothetical protein
MSVIAQSKGGCGVGSCSERTVLGTSRGGLSTVEPRSSFISHSSALRRTPASKPGERAQVAGNCEHQPTRTNRLSVTTDQKVVGS